MATSSTTPKSSDVYSFIPLSGQLNWMLRWMPVDAITLDISGSSIVTALNFGVFGGGAGLNLATLIGALKMSLTFHV